MFGAYGIPYSIDRRVPFGHTGIGRGLLALIRCASLGGSADDLLTYLRTPGRLRRARPGRPARGRPYAGGAHSAAQARALWEENNFELSELDRLARARDASAFVAELEARLGSLFAAPHERKAAILRGPELEDPRALREGAGGAARAACRAGPGGARGGRVDAARVRRVLEQLEVHLGEPPQPDRVQVARPEAIRARRFEAVFVCGLQEGEFPGGAGSRALPVRRGPARDRDRHRAACCRCARTRLDRERYLFYLCCSRAERLLVLSSRSSDEEGNPQSQSFFVEDVRDLLAPERPSPGARCRT